MPTTCFSILHHFTSPKFTHVVMVLSLLSCLQSCGVESGSDERQVYFSGDSQASSGQSNPETTTATPSPTQDTLKLQAAKTDWSGEENLGSELFFIATVD